ncbi:hypothetical protein [Helicobacter bilis]|nr:hypothetical protein [Helicobacter bilis]
MDCKTLRMQNCNFVSQVWRGKYGSINDKMDCHDLLCRGRNDIQYRI